MITPSDELKLDLIDLCSLYEKARSLCGQSPELAYRYMERFDIHQEVDTYFFMHMKPTAREICSILEERYGDHRARICMSPQTAKARGYDLISTIEPRIKFIKAILSC